MKPAQAAKQSELPMPTPVPTAVKPLEVMPTPAPKVQLTAVEMRAAALKETQRMPKPMEPVQPAMVETPAPMEKIHPLLKFLDALELAAIVCKAWVMHLKHSKPRLPDFAKWNPMRGLPKRKTQAISLVGGPEAGPVQAELSLEKVRVMRNDLSDADLEIAPMKPAQPKPARRESGKPVKQKIEEPAELAGVEN